MTLTASQQPFKLGIVVLAHNRPEQLAILLGVLRHPQVTIYLHVDRGVNIQPFRSVLAEGGVDDVVWVERHRSAWGSLGIVDPELEGIQRAIADDCSYVMLISGEDFPLRPVSEIVEFARENQNRSYVETFALPHAGWPSGGRERTDYYTWRLWGGLYTCFPFGEDTSGMTRPRTLLNWVLRARFIFKPRRRFPASLRRPAAAQPERRGRCARPGLRRPAPGLPSLPRLHRLPGRALRPEHLD